MAIKFLNSVAVDTDVLFVDTANESVGIGTTNPHYYNNYKHLTINGASGAGLMLRNNGSSKYEQYTDSGGTIFYNFANVPLKFYTNATEKFRINGSGNVGIGTTSPGAKLNVAGDILINSGEYISWGTVGATSIEGSTASNKLQFRTNSSDRMIIDSTGNVGIGTTSPSEKLEVAGDIKAVDSSNRSITLNVGSSNQIIETTGGLNIGAGTGSVRVTQFGQNSELTVDDSAQANKIVLKSNGISYLNGGNVGIGTTSPGSTLTVSGPSSNQFQIINSANNKSWRPNVNGNDFYITESGVSNPFVIQAGGKVGIGTTNPNRSLHVIGQVAIDNSTSPSGGLLVSPDGTSNKVYSRTGNAASSAHPLDFISGSSTSMRIDTSGNVGIGTTSPDYKLDVAGTFRVKHANSAVAIQEYSSGATIWMDGVDGDFVGGDYFNISAYGATDLAFGHGAATKMTLKNTGNLGIGTTSPGAKLEVVVADDTFNDVNVLKLKRIWATGSGSDRAHGVSFTDNNSTLATIYADRTNSGANYNSDLLFATNTGASGTSLSTRMIIKHTGNVGIGTSFPDEMLHIENSLGANIILNSNTGAVNNGIYMSEGASSTPTQNGAYFYYDSAANAVKLDTGTSSLSTKLTVLRDSGNVGIGATSPTQKLHVDGNTLISAEKYYYAAGTGAGFGSDASGNFKIRQNGADLIFGSGNNVGIGTTSPDRPLSVVGGNSMVARFQSTNTTSFIQLSNTVSTADQVRIGSNGTNLVLSTNYAERMRITSVGAVQFNAYDSTNNTGTPTYLLGTDASGNIVKTNTIPGSGAGPYLPLAGGTMTGNTVHNDNVKSIYGTASDGLEIYHDGTDSYINDTGTGGLIIRAANNIKLQTNQAELYLQGIKDGAVKLYYNNAEKLVTTTDGTLITGGWTTTGNSITYGNIHFPDGRKAEFGTSQDLQIYHDGSNSYITDSGTGDLIITADNDLTFKDGSGNTMANMNASNSVELMFGNSKKFETTSTGVTVTGLMQASTVGVTNIVTNKVVKFNGSILDDSNITDTGSLITLGSAVTATGTMTSPTFLGDLNGTINTVTTAVTKANATNDTTVATTAFVQNLIGTIPAGLVFQGTWNAATNTPTLTSGSGTTGHFYIVSTSGSTNLDGVTDWVTGDWAVFIEQGGTDAWEKIDNSSVLDGAGTGQTLPLWSGSGTSNTLTNSKLVQNTAGTLITAFTNSTGNTGNFITNSEGGGEVGLTVQSRTNRAKLRVADNDSNAYVVAEAGKAFFGTSANGDATNISVLTSGNVGIGTTSPLTKLHIAGATDANIIRIENTNTALSFGDTIGAIQFFNNDTTDDSPNVAASIYATAGASGGSGSLRFKTIEPGVEGDPATEAMIITNGGNVGIGTTSPANRLEIVGPYTSTPLKVLRHGDYGNVINIGRNGVSETANIGYPADSTINLSTSGSERMRITSAGDTGIGVTTPRAKLDVAGGVKVADDTDTAGANKVGTLRYRTSGNNSYVDMCMQTGASTYAWINVVQNNW